MIENTVSRIINQIQNSVIIKNYGVEIPRNRITKNLAKILFTEGFIEDVMETIFTSKKNIPFLFIRLKYHPIQRISIITKLQLISHSRLRVYIKQKELSQVLGKLNLLFLSTSQGLIISRESLLRNLGGEILFSICLIPSYPYENSIFDKENL